MNYFLYISLFLLLIATYLLFYNGGISSLKLRTTASLLVFISTVFYIFYGISDYFTGQGITNSVIYFIKYGLKGAGFLEYKKLIIVSILLSLIGIIFSLTFLLKNKKDLGKKYYILFFLILSIILNPVTISAAKFIYLKKENKQSIIYNDFYRINKIPNIKQIDKAKNFIFIYAESLERTYFDESLFPNLVPNLKKIESESLSFTNIMQEKAYSYHTIGGIIASQCGFPLISPSHANLMNQVDEYLPQAICLGDLLNKEGYYLTYNGGADLNFAGKGKFLSTHGFKEVKGKNELLTDLTDKKYVTGWGLYDDSLFDFIYNKFIKLSKEKSRFGIFTLTLDTHHPKGTVSKSCNKIIYKDGSNPILNSVACSDYLISNFIRKIRESEYSKNTVIIIASDHIAMQNTASEILDTGNRRNLLIINDPENIEPQQDNNGFSNFDIGSTILNFIGYDGLIGLGKNRNKEIISESEIIDMYKNLYKWKPSILQLWNFPTINKEIKFDIEKNYIYVDDRFFSIPIILQINDKLEIIPHFDFSPPKEKKLNIQITDITKTDSFLLIDKCNDTNSLSDKKILDDGFCLLMGRNKKNMTYKTIDSNSVISKQEIVDLFKKN
jgi:phosphoglycerol transferase